MLQVQDGQCGMCMHFGETKPQDQPKLIQIRTSHEAPDDLVEPCGLPANADRHLMVTPVSGCDGFTPAAMAQAD